MNTLHYLVEWALAMVEHWEVLVFSGVLGIGLELSKRFRDWEPSKKIFGAIVTLGLLISIFLAWKDEREKYEKEVLKHMPQLEVTLNQTIAGLSPQLLPNESLVIFIGSVSNSGEMPSVVRNWKLHVHLTDDPNEPQANLLGSDAKQFVATNPVGEVEQFSWEKGYLPELTANEPITQGANRVGFVAFRVLNVAPEKIKKKGNSFELCIEDVIHKTRCGDRQVFTDSQGHPIYVPGLPR
jgi:hypothetical protein